MKNMLSAMELGAMEAIVHERGFTGVCCGLADMCGQKKRKVDDDGEATALRILETLFECVTNEVRIILMGQHNAADVRELFACHKDLLPQIRGLTEPSVPTHTAKGVADDLRNVARQGEGERAEQLHVADDDQSDEPAEGS
jgi:hypothetical protein